MRYLTLLLLWPALSFGQGALLLSPSTKALSAVDASRLSAMRERPRARSTTLVSVDAKALNSNVVAVEIDGKTYRFVGQLTKGSEDLESWIGRSGDDSAIFTRDSKGGVIGIIRVGLKDFTLGQVGASGVLMEDERLPPEPGARYIGTPKPASTKGTK